MSAFSLLPGIKGKKIVSTEIDLPRMILHPSVPEFSAGIAGRIITDVGRKGKYLTLCLDDDCYILAHVKRKHT